MTTERTERRAMTWSAYLNCNPRGGDINIRSGPQMREYELIADRIAAERVGPVLDWGCGWGQVSHLLLERGVDVVSFEYREGETHRSVSLEHFPDVHAHLSGEPVALPFPDDHFEAVLSCGVLEHVQDPGASLTELHRILRPGGRLFVYKLPNRFSYLEVIARAMGLYYHGKLQYDRVYDRSRVYSLIPSRGFRIDAFRRTNMVPLTLSNAFAWRHTDEIMWLNRALGRTPVVNLLATNLELDATVMGKSSAVGAHQGSAVAAAP
ncbi:MAG TPA: class I SAM-dependent methyltransferase [Solirubrobacteraceae bacterium]